MSNNQISLITYNTQYPISINKFAISIHCRLNVAKSSQCLHGSKVSLWYVKRTLSISRWRSLATCATLFKHNPIELRCPSMVLSKDILDLFLHPSRIHSIIRGIRSAAIRWTCPSHLSLRWLEMTSSFCCPHRALTSFLVTISFNLMHTIFLCHSWSAASNLLMLVTVKDLTDLKLRQAM